MQYAREIWEGNEDVKLLTMLNLKPGLYPYRLLPPAKPCKSYWKKTKRYKCFPLPFMSLSNCMSNKHPLCLSSAESVAAQGLAWDGFFFSPSSNLTSCCRHVRAWRKKRIQCSHSQPWEGFSKCRPLLQNPSPSEVNEATHITPLAWLSTSKEMSLIWNDYLLRVKRISILAVRHGRVCLLFVKESSKTKRTQKREGEMQLSYIRVNTVGL